MCKHPREHRDAAEREGYKLPHCGDPACERCPDAHRNGYAFGYGYAMTEPPPEDPSSPERGADWGEKP
jgi:hypothetical protein